LDWCQDHRVTLIPIYLSTSLNYQADWLSRGKALQEWQLSFWAYRVICNRWGCPQVDLFASQFSAKTRDYFTLDRSDDRSLGCNAMVQTWPESFLYAFPPTFLISQVLQRFPLNQRCVLILPLWHQASWYTTAQNLARDSIIFRPHRHLITCLTSGKPTDHWSSLSLQALLI